MREYLRPWKVSSLAIGLGLLLVGADYYQAPDWDYTISFIMATLTYLTAPWAVRAFLARNGRKMLLGLFFYYFTVDGCYWLYWHAVKPDALVMREANFYASSCLYWLCGFIWLHTGPLKKLLVRRRVELPGRISFFPRPTRPAPAAYGFSRHPRQARRG